MKMKPTIIIENLSMVLKKEDMKNGKRKSRLKNAYAKFERIGINTKSTYSLPLKDTLGKTFREQLLQKSV